MSLLTDALRLREGRRPSRGQGGPSLPPFRGPQPGRWILAVLVLCGLAVLGWWKGAWVIERMEELAGIPPDRLKPNLLAAAEPAGARPVEPEAPARESVPAGVSSREESPKVAPAPVASAPPAETRTISPKGPEGVMPETAPVAKVAAEMISPEGKQRGEILLTDSLVKAVAEKKPDAPAPAASGEAPVAAQVPSGGLQPMKVELAAAELMWESPEVREKKRVELVEDFLRVLKVQGVRLQGAESRILVDGAPIGLGEKVGAVGLVLESVEPQKIIFSDASGKKYPKSY